MQALDTSVFQGEAVVGSLRTVVVDESNFVVTHHPVIPHWSVGAPRRMAGVMVQCAGRQASPTYILNRISISISPECRYEVYLLHDLVAEAYLDQRCIPSCV